MVGINTTSVVLRRGLDALPKRKRAFMKRTLILFLLIISMLITISCNQKSEKQDNVDENKIVNIAVLAYREKDTFISDLTANMQNYIEKLNHGQVIMNVVIVDSDNDQEIQSDQLNTFIEQGFDALCVNIVDRNKAADMIDMARAADIPLVFFNREPVRIDMSRWSKVYYVGSKAEESGQLQGNKVVDYWKNNDADLNDDGIMQCVVFMGEPNHQDSILRTEHIFNVLDQSGIKYETLVTYTANWQRDLAKSSMDLCLDIFEDDIDMIICNNDDMALGAVDSMKGNYRFDAKELIPTFGIDATPDAKRSISMGELTGTVLNDGKGQAEAIIDLALAVCQKDSDEQNIPKYKWVPYQKYTK
jgi:methyl-galactoside transport system substrate-binding protein